MPYVQVGDVEMFYERFGTGEPVLFLHSGYSRGILAFASQIPDFQRTYDCYFPDFRGHGRTRCASLEWSMPQLAEDTNRFMDALGIEYAHIVGYSLGAGVGVYLAVRCPSRVATLTTIGFGGVAESTGVEDFEPEAIEARGDEAMIASIIERHYEAHRGDWRTFMRQSALDWRRYPDLSDDEYRSIRCPALWITGELDGFAGEARVTRLARLVEGSRTLVVPGSGHRPHMLREQPLLVNDTILAFLADYSMERKMAR